MGLNEVVAELLSLSSLECKDFSVTLSGDLFCASVVASAGLEAITVERKGFAYEVHRIRSGDTPTTLRCEMGVLLEPEATEYVSAVAREMRAKMAQLNKPIS